MSSAPESTPSDSVTSTDVFSPPPGGDLTLRSSDGVEFLVHALMLKVASSVFDNMSVVGTTNDVIDLSEDAETLSIMLQSIYPNTTTPMMIDFDMLSKCLSVAQKYDLGGMLGNLDDQIAANGSPHNLLSKNPVLSHKLALQFNLPKTQVAAAPLVMTTQVDLCDHSRIAEFVQNHPPASLIRLFGIQGARARILADTLFSYDKSPMLGTWDSLFFDLSCEACQTWREECKDSSPRKGLYTQPPSWLLAWASLAYQTLLATPLAMSDELFSATVLQKFEQSSTVCQDCLADFWSHSSQRPLFNLWAEGVKVVLKERLDKLQPLYSL